jgi:predicted nucleic acid-binding protein
LTQAEAELACGILRFAKIQIHAMGPQAALALQMAAELEHAVYDTTYLALARVLDLPMVTADRRLVNKRAALKNPAFPELVLLA